MRDTTSNQPAANSVIPAAEAAHLPGLLRCRAKRTPELPAYRQYVQGQWVTWSWQRIDQEMGRWRQALAAEGLEAGDRVAMLLANSVEWVCFEQAALGLGLVVVPFYTWDNPENLAYLLHDSGARLLLTGTVEQWQQLAPWAERFPGLQRVLCLEGQPPPTTGVEVVSVGAWLPSVAERAPELGALDPGGLATIIYTSGTTGPPKGVMLSHAAILANAEAILKVIPCFPADILLSILPLSHAFERTVGYYTPMMAGCSVAYCRSIEHLAEDLQTIRPTILIAVPRVYEKIAARVNQRVQEKSRVARNLFDLAKASGWRHFEGTQGRGPRSFVQERLLHPLLRRLVAQTILDRFGGRIRFAVSGGAPLRESVSRLFLGLGLPLIQGYGLTEAGPVVSTNVPERNIPASVGPPLPGVQCRVGTDGELLVRGPNLMLGYWNQPDTTGEAIDQEGWLHTGDVVAMRDGAIHVRGRLKEIIVMSTGEKVAPADLEMAITADPLVDQAVVVGEGRPFLAALLVLQPRSWEQLAAGCGLDPRSPDALRAEAARTLVLDKAAGLLHAFPAHAQIHAVDLLLDEWSISNGLLTPTLKVKRALIEERYAAAIDALYADHSQPG